MAFLWFGGFKPPLPPQLWWCSWPRREGRAGVSSEQRRDGVWPRPSKHTHTHTTFGFLRLGGQSALLLSSQSLRAQIRCYRSPGLISPYDCFEGGVKMLVMSVLKEPVDPLWHKIYIFPHLALVEFKQILWVISPGYLTPRYFCIHPNTMEVN